MAPKHGKRKKQHERNRPKLQPIVSVSKNNSADELWDGILTRPRSIDEVNANEQLAAGDVPSDKVNELMKRNQSADVCVSDVESSFLGGAADKATRAAAESKPMITPPNVHNMKTTAAAATTRTESLSPGNLAPIAENVNYNYASKYIMSDDISQHYSTTQMMSSISPPRTPEPPSVKSPENDNQTPDTVNTDSTTKDEESAEALEPQQQPVLDKCVHNDEIDITSTPIVSNVTTTAAAAAGESISTVLPQHTQIKEGVKNPHNSTSQRPKRKRKKRLQPRSALFSPEQPKTPDEDMYHAFGLDLHKTCSERGSAVDQAMDENDVKRGLDSKEAAIIPIQTTIHDIELDMNPDETSSSRRTSSLSLNIETLTPDNDCDNNDDNQLPTKKTRRTSSVSFSDNPNNSNASFNTSTVHLIGSRSEEESGRGDDDDSDADSCFTSDDDMSYFNELKDCANADTRPSAATRMETVDLPKLPQLPMRTTHATSSADDPIEMRLSLSLSEDEDYYASHQEELVLYQTYNPTKGDSFGSSLVESASESEQEEDVEDEKPPRPVSNNSFTSGSDDAGVVNELSVYHISSKINALTTQSTSPPSCHALSKSTNPSRKSSNSETPTPTHADGAKYIYDNVQSAVVDVKANSGAHKPTSSIDNSVGTSISSLQQHSIKERSPAKVKQMHSPGGAFESTPRRHKEVLTGFDSLAYSEDRQDHVPFYESAEDVTPFRHMKQEFDEEMIASMTVCQNKHPVALSSRWSVLFSISILNLMAGWTCFSAAPILSIVKDAFSFEYITPDYLVSIFLLASCVGGGVEPVLRGRIGLRKTIVFGALLLMVGNLVTSGGGPFFHLKGVGWRLCFGFFAVGFSHPFYQNTISIVINDWFPENENRLVTNIALSCFQLGIILSFMFGTMVVNSQDDLDDYFQLLSLISVMTFVLVSFLVEDAPMNQSSLRRILLPKIMVLGDAHVSKSDVDLEYGETLNAKTESNPLLNKQSLPLIPSPVLERYGSMDCKSTTSLPRSTRQAPPNLDADTWSLVKTCFSFGGFSHCTIAYVASGVVNNTILTFISDFVVMNEAPKLDIWMVGAGFQLITMVSAYIFGKFTNKSRTIYHIILTLLVLGAVVLLLCSLRLGVMLSLDICILALGFLVGPVMHLCTALGCKVTRSLGHDDVSIVQRFISNGISGASLPLFSLLHHYSVARGALHEFTLSFYFLIFVMAGSAVYFSFFNSPSLFYDEEFQIPANRVMRFQHWMPPGNIATN